MMYPYMTLADETEIVNSQIIEKDGIKKVIVNFERPTENGFDSASNSTDYFMHEMKMNNDYQIKERCSLYTPLFLIGMVFYFSSSLCAYVSILPS